MKNLIHKKINLEAIPDCVTPIYLDDEIVLIENVKELPLDGSLLMDMIVVVFCTEGKLQVDINGKTYLAMVDDMLVCTPNSFVDNYMITPDFRAKIMGFSFKTIQHLLNVNKDIWNMVLFISKNPIFHLGDDFYKLFELYYSLVSFKITQKECRYNKEIMHAIFEAIFYEMCQFYISFMDNEKEAEDSHMKQGDLLLKRFLKLLHESEGKVRSVAVFAEKLCITPKYLTSVCKVSSGKTALEWIHEFATEVIVQHLKYSELSIKEISETLCFPNISFFGKFVKTRLGVSPTEYRRRLNVK